MKPCHILLLLVLVVFTQATIAAQPKEQVNAPADGGRSELKVAVASPEVKEDLASPDGVALQLLPGGGWRIFARGSGTYDFNEADEIRGATSDAQLRAKAAVAKFLSERVTSKDAMENISVKTKRLMAKSGEAEPSAEILKTDIQKRVESVVAVANEVLRGLVVLESSKTPVGKGGTIQVTVGVSSKSQAVADAVRNGKPVTGTELLKPSGKQGTNGVGTLTNENSPQKKKTKTDF